MTAAFRSQTLNTMSCVNLWTLQMKFYYERD